MLVFLLLPFKATYPSMRFFYPSLFDLLFVWCGLLLLHYLSDSQSVSILLNRKTVLCGTPSRVRTKKKAKRN
jgi:hypothetical protein